MNILYIYLKTFLGCPEICKQINVFYLLIDSL